MTKQKPSSKKTSTERDFAPQNHLDISVDAIQQAKPRRKRGSTHSSQTSSSIIRRSSNNFPSECGTPHSEMDLNFCNHQHHHASGFHDDEYHLKNH